VSERTGELDRAPTPELKAALEDTLQAHFDEPVAIERLDRRPCPYRTSFPLEELDVVTRDGRAIRLVFKDLSRESLSPRVQNVKPEFLHDPLREIEAYLQILARAQLGTAVCYGATIDPDRHRHWLFIENVEGVALWQIGELETWAQTARWLAGMHDRYEDERGWKERAEHLVRYDAAFYRLWPDRALAFARRSGRSDGALPTLERIAQRYDPVLERLTSLPNTFIHGEFYPSNILVSHEQGSVRVCPIDWELAGVGPGLIDVAALTTGGSKGWGDDDREALAAAYRDAAGSIGAQFATNAAFQDALDCCRLHLALQWLGWAADWSPPDEHRQDWLGEALRVADRLDL
jgi:aminoglycoside phosphotransferase (APT) family kinase protein